MYVATPGSAGNAELTYVSEYDEEYGYEPWEDEECYHGFGACIDPDCRDLESCLCCELLYPADDDTEALS